MGSYEDTSWSELHALTRLRRAQKAALDGFRRTPPIRFAGESYEFGPPRYDAPDSTGRRKSLSQRWRVREWKAGNRRCYYCDVRLVTTSFVGVTQSHPNLATVDHRQPLALGGDDNPRNYAMACNRCNNRKGAMTEAEFRAVLAFAEAA